MQTHAPHRHAPASTCSPPTRTGATRASTARLMRSRRGAVPGASRCATCTRATPTTTSTSPPNRRALAAARLVVLLHPVQWYSMPPLLKLWLDEVLRASAGPTGRAARAARQGPVAGRHHRRAGGRRTTREGYNRYFFDAFLPPYEQTAALCGMRFLPPLLLHGAHRAGDAEVARARRASCRSAWPSYPDWPELAEAGAEPGLRRAGRRDRPAELSA